MESTNENSIGNNLKHKLFDLQTLNGQVKFKQSTNNISDKNTSSLMESGYTDDDVMILEDKAKAQEVGNATVTTQGTKPGSFAINDNIRNSFKDMISKIQTPSLGILLSKTKCLNTRDKNPVLSGATLSQNTEKKISSSGNLFDNLKEIQIESGTNHVNSPTTVKPVISEPDLITLDGPDDQPKVEGTSMSPNTVDESSQGAEGSIQSIHSLDSSSQDSTERNNCNSDVQQSYEENSRSCSEKTGDSKAHSINQDTDMEVSLDSVDSKSVATNSDKLDLSSPSHTNLSSSVEGGSNLGNTVCDNNTSVQFDSCDKNFDLIKGKSERVSESRIAENELLSFNSSELEKEKRDLHKDEEEDEVNLLLLDDSSRESVVSKSVDNAEDVKDTEDDKNEDRIQCKKVGGELDKPIEVSNTEVKKESKEEYAAFIQNSSSKLQSPTLEVKSEKSENCEDLLLTDIKEDKDDIDCKSDEKERLNSIVTEKDSKNVPKQEEQSDVDRKRPADSEMATSEPKRSRLEVMIGKLGSQIGISPDAIPMDEDDVSEESVTDSATESTTPTSAETEEEEESDASPRKKKKRSVRMSEKALDNLLKAKIRKFLLSEKEGIVAELQRKVEELSSLKEEWKAKARDLSKQITDVTILQQKYEKRKAKTAALKQISTKNIGVQVDIKYSGMVPAQQERQEVTPTKVPLPNTSPQTSSSPSQRPGSIQQRTPPAAQRLLPKAPAPVLTPGPPNHNLVPPKTNLITVSQNKPPLMQQSSQGTVVQQTMPSFNQISTSNTAANISAGTLNPTVKNLLDSARNMNASAAASANIGKPMLPTGFLVVTSIPSAGLITPTTKPLSSVPQTVTAVNTVVAQNQVKFIDLTVEEEGSKGVLNSTRPVQIASGTGNVVAQPSMVVPANSMIRHVQPTAQGLPAGGVLLTPPLVQTNQQQAIQFVFNSSSPAVRPGTLINITNSTNTTSGVRTSSPVTNVAPQVRAPMLVRQTVPVSSNNSARPLVPPSNPVPRHSMSTAQSQTTVSRPPPPLQSAPQANVKSTPSAVNPKPQLTYTHPAPLPLVNFSVSPKDKPIPPRPNLKISRVSQGIVLSWNMVYDASKYAEIKSYQLYAYQEGSAPPSTSLWKKVGDVNALPLPMACTLTQFQEGNKYHFAVRPVDTLGRYGQFSDPGTIHLKAYNSKD